MTEVTFQPRPDVAPPAAWRFPGASRRVLDNGLTVVRYDLLGRPLTSVQLVLDLPSNGDPDGLDGATAIMARTLDEGTSAHDGAAFAAALARCGAAYGCWTSHSGVRLELSVAVARLATALPLLSEAVRTPTFPQDELDRLVKQELDGLVSRRATPTSRARMELLARCFDPTSRMSRPVAGTEQSLARLDRKAIARHYADHVCPGVATLVLAGDFTGVDADAAVDTAFGPWPAGEPERSAAVDPVGTRPGVTVVDRPGSVQSVLDFGCAGVDRRHPRWAELSVGAYALGGSINSRLSALLREEKGYTYGIRAQFVPERRGGLFIVSSAVDADVTGPAVADVLRVVDGQLASGITAKERDDAVDFMLGVSPVRFQTADAVARQAAEQFLDELPPDYLDRRNAALREVTAESASTAFADAVTRDDLGLVVVGDAERIVGPLAEAGVSDVTVVPA
ncbi:MAG: insulinase family protein [Acidothermales bacterium]|nr:insulinase family protein [Acidothermales bacterium]